MDRRLTLVLVAAAWAGAACARTSVESPPPPPLGTEPQALRSAPVDGQLERIETPMSPVAGRDLTRLDGAVQRFSRDRAGRLPTSLRDLTAEKSPDGAPYARSVPVDPWGQPYAYAVLNARLGSYDLRSYGPDRMPGTADDVVARADPVETH